MAGTTAKPMQAAEAYFADLRDIRASGGGTGELSCYPALANLFRAAGAWLNA